MPAGYVTNLEAQVNAWYGAALTAAQLVQVDAWQAAAEAVIDGATGRSWGGGAVTDERHTLDGPYVYCRRRPLASATVTVTSYQRGSTTGRLLRLTDEYEVDDLAQGRLYVPAWRGCRGGYLLISYTAATTAPRAISDATAALLADWLATGGPDGPAGAITRTQTGDVNVEYGSASSTPAAPDALPAQVQQLLAAYRAPLLFA